MIFGWLEYGKTDRWILIDPIFPWPALHHGREALRKWADQQNHLRATALSPGPRRMPWPCRTSVKEAGDAVLNVWPVEVYGQPRIWGEDEGMWRPALANLAEFLAFTIACEVRVNWVDGGPYELVGRAKSLKDQPGFIGWARGEHEPRRLSGGPVLGELKSTISGGDVRPLPQGELPWH